MKKTSLILIALLLSLTASAQLKFGVKGGLNVTDMKFNKEVLNSKNKIGFFIGPTLKLTLPVVGLGVDLAALYDQREAELGMETGTNAGASNNLKRQAINVPLNLRYGFGLGDLAEVFVKAGPQFGFNIGDKNIDAYKDWTWKSSEFSVNLGFGATIASHLEISANYNVVCGKTGEVKNVLDTMKDYNESKNNAWQISAAYYF